MDPKKRRKHKARSGGLCQQRMITNDVRQVVTSITAITANPANIEKTDKFQRPIILKNIVKNANPMHFPCVLCL